MEQNHHNIEEIISEHALNYTIEYVNKHKIDLEQRTKNGNDTMLTLIIWCNGDDFTYRDLLLLTSNSKLNYTKHTSIINDIILTLMETYFTAKCGSYEDDRDAFDYFIQNGADISNESSILQAQIVDEQYDFIKYVLDAGYNPSKRFYDNIAEKMYTVYEYAVEWSTPKIAELIREYEELSLIKGT